jgi:hypothetical protein
MSDSTLPQRAARFTDQNQGALPEKITEKDLEILNQGLDHWRALLREARRQYDEDIDDGRAAAFTALAATWQLIVLFKSAKAEQLQLPIIKLQNALVSLDNNLVLPIVKPTPRRGRAHSSQVHLSLKGLAAGTVKRLTDTGLGRRESHRAVADLLSKSGVRAERGAGSVTATTVKNWCVEVASDFGRKGAAALMYDSMFVRPEEQDRLASMRKDQARKSALAELEQWVKFVLCPQIPT